MKKFSPTNMALFVKEETGVGNLTGRQADLKPEFADMAQRDAEQTIGF